MAASYITSVENLMTGRPGGVAGVNIPNPTVSDYSDGFTIDPTNRSPKDAGYVQTSARFTSIPRAYHVRYIALTTHDKDLISDFETDTVVGGSESFAWRRPGGAGNIMVRFAAPIRYWPWQASNYTRWNVEFDVESVGGV